MVALSFTSSGSMSRSLGLFLKLFFSVLRGQNEQMNVNIMLLTWEVFSQWAVIRMLGVGEAENGRKSRSLCCLSVRGFLTARVSLKPLAWLCCSLWLPSPAAWACCYLLPFLGPDPVHHPAFVESLGFFILLFSRKTTPYTEALKWGSTVFLIQFTDML